MNTTKGLVVPAGGGKHLDMMTPGRFAALKLLGHETNESVRDTLIQKLVAPTGFEPVYPSHGVDAVGAGGIPLDR
jgi:hypothetical protein